MVMNSEEKFSVCVAELGNTPKPSTNDTNLLADFVELLIVFSSESGISYGDIKDRFFGEPDENQTAEVDDKNEAYIRSIFNLIDERIAQFGDNYPFMKDEHGVFIIKEHLSSEEKIYICLLLSSSLDIFHQYQTELTTDFETICYETMKLFLPNATVKAFGKNSEYTGTAREKIIKLANDIGLEVNNHEIQEINERNNQERGLDIVGWLPFKDTCQNKIVFLGQCACGKQYESKQHDARRYMEYYIYYKTEPQLTLFVPYSLINPSCRKFYHSDLIERDYLIFERLRILSLLESTENIFEHLRAKDLVEKCIGNYHV